jgi:hypothetical protein
MFNPVVSKTNLIDALNKIEFGNLGVRIDPAGLKLRASGIALACELFSNFIEEMTADAAASMSLGRVDECDARAISDVGQDLSGAIVHGAELHLEAAE